MPAIRPTARKQIVPSGDGKEGDRRGRRRQSQLLNQKGIPRYDDLLTARFLEQTPTVSLPMNTATKQARAVPWTVEASVDNPTPTHNIMADRIVEFIDGNFNNNGQSWDQLLGLILNDSVSIDTGVLEFVPTEDTVAHPETGEQVHWLSEVYAVDGTTVSKSLDQQDRMPNPPDPAFYKWGNVPNASGKIIDTMRGSDLFDMYQLQRLQRATRQKAVGMTRDEMAILETNSQPRELSVYGRGIVQQVRPWAEILLNQDQANVRHFAEDEYAKGILNIGEQYAGEIETFREYWDDNVRGKTATTLPKIASESVEFVPFNESLKELQYLESQQWYSKLVWMLFGEATSTMGLAEDANYSTIEGQKEDVFVNTTLPRLHALEEYLNQHWLPKMREYWLADGELEFRFKPEEHPIMATQERKKRRDDLANGLTTPNRILEREGRDTVPWGDVPAEAVSAFAREHPEWVLEEWGGVEGVPDPADDDPAGFFSHEPRDKGEGESESETGGMVDSDTSEPATPEVFDSADVTLAEALDSPEQYTKEPLRNERDGSLPDLTSVVDEGTERLAGVIGEAFEQMQDGLEQQWPEDEETRGTTPDSAKGAGVNYHEILRGIDLRDGLVNAITPTVAAAMSEGANTEATQVAKEIADRVSDGEADVIANFDVEDTFAFERMQRKAASDMVTVEETVKEKIRQTMVEAAEDGEGLQGATERLRDRVDELSDSHARLVSRTEALDASRHGSQALAESADAIGGKRWRSSKDGRTRPWHADMDGVVVPKDGDFSVPGGYTGDPDYQPRDYPRSAFVVGDDQPFRCRCTQQSVLAEDMPDEVSAFRDYGGVQVRFTDNHRGPDGAAFVLEYDLSERQFEVREAHRDAPDETFADVWTRIRANHSKTAATDAIGVSKTTVGNWDDAVGV